jgi:predicted GNAT family acetyltransferase
MDGRGPSDAVERTERARLFIASGRLHLWEADGQLTTSTFASSPEAGVVRIGFVFTPPEQRGRGYASALVAAVSSATLRDGARCILYTQLANPTSNAIYQRLGYRPIGELVRYAFG